MGTPSFDQAVYAADREAVEPVFSASSLGSEKRAAGFEFAGRNPVMNRMMETDIQGNPTRLSGFFLHDFKRISGLKVLDLIYGDASQVGGPEIGIDAEDKQSKISGLIRKQEFYAIYVNLAPDGFNFGGLIIRPLRVFQPSGMKVVQIRSRVYLPFEAVIVPGHAFFESGFYIFFNWCRNYTPGELLSDFFDFRLSHLSVEAFFCVV